MDEALSVKLRVKAKLTHFIRCCRQGVRETEAGLRVGGAVTLQSLALELQRRAETFTGDSQQKVLYVPVIGSYLLTICPIARRGCSARWLRWCCALRGCRFEASPALQVSN